MDFAAGMTINFAGGSLPTKNDVGYWIIPYMKLDIILDIGYNSIREK